MTGDVFALGGAIGPSGFAVITWGSVLLVAVAFGYVVRRLLLDRRRA